MRLFISFFLLMNISLFAAELKFSLRNDQVFADIEDDYYLMNYFINNNQKRYFRKLDDQDKKNYLRAFWHKLDSNPTTENNEFLEAVEQRIIYADENYTHFKSGWKTDRGRIYVRFGKPYEISNQKTTNTKYTQREYEIWKYRLPTYRNYIFIDLQQHGDYRLIYSNGDDKEGSWADWRSYLGSEFDESLLN